jgi:hypothetical protein
MMTELYGLAASFFEDQPNEDNGNGEETAEEGVDIPNDEPEVIVPGA